MLLTVPIKLLTTEIQKRKLLNSMFKFNTACNFISEWCFANKCFRQFQIHKELYYQIRAKFNLPAEFTIRAIARVANTYKVDKEVQHFFKSKSSVEYDCNNLNWRDFDTISISSIDGRLKNISTQFGQYAKLKERVVRKTADLVYQGNAFYLHAVAEIPEEQIKSVEQFIGVDLGISNIATTSDHTIYSSEQTEKIRQRYLKLRKSLQRTGTKSAKKKLKRISKKERNFKKNTNHNISKQIITEAQRHNKGIAMEDLHLFKKTVRKEQRNKHGKWAFGELLSFVEYKAKIAGIPLILVNPAYTSQTCSICGHCEKANRNGEKFYCKQCGYENHADINAAINISKQAEAYIGYLKVFLKLLEDYTGSLYPARAAVNRPIVALKKRKPRKRQSDKSVSFTS